MICEMAASKMGRPRSTAKPVPEAWKLVRKVERRCQCQACGFVWFVPADVKPAQCANRACKRRNWDRPALKYTRRKK